MRSVVGRHNMPRPLQVVTKPAVTRFSCKETCINIQQISSLYRYYPRRSRSAIGVDIVLTLDVCMFVCLYVC